MKCNITIRSLCPSFPLPPSHTHTCQFEVIDKIISSVFNCGIFGQVEALLHIIFNLVTTNNWPLLLLLLVGGGAKEEQQRLNLSGTLCRPSIRPITIFHRFFFFFFCFIQISLLAVFSKPSGLLQILSQYIYI